MASNQEEPLRPELPWGPGGQDRVSVGLCRAGLHTGCYVSYYSQFTATPVWYLLEFAGPECMVEIQDSDHSFFDEDKSEMEQLLETSDVVWFAGDEAEAVLSRHFPGSRPSVIRRLVSWIARGRV